MPLPADTYLTLDSLNKLFQNLVIQILGLNQAITTWAAYQAAVAAHTWNIDNPIPANPYELVRVSWPTGGAPGWKITDNVCFLRVICLDDPYSQQRHLSYAPYDSTTLVESSGMTLVNNVQFILYGPNSFDNGRLLIDRIYRQENHDVLARSKVYIIPRNVFPKRIPELFQGQYWDRTDLTIAFNELVVRNEQRAFLDSAQITLETKDKTINAALTSTTIIHN